MANVITLKHADVYAFEILVDGETVGNFDHDTHGWVGMEAAEKLAIAIAKKLNIDVVVLDGEE